MDLPIRNISDLRGEIYRLRGLEQVQSAAIRERFKSPSALLSTIMSLFRGRAEADGEGAKGSGFFNQDIAGLISRFVLPFALNKTIFRNSGFIMKALVGLASQKASHFITEDLVVSLWERANSLFKHKEKDPEMPVHKGVPPESETY